MIKKLKSKVSDSVNYFVGSKDELSKVSWPSKEEISRFTLVTIITTVLVALFLWGVDMTLTQLVKAMLR